MLERSDVGCDPLRDLRYKGAAAAREQADWLKYLELAGKGPRTLVEYERITAELRRAFPLKRFDEFTDGDISHVLAAVSKSSRGQNKTLVLTARTLRHRRQHVADVAVRELVEPLQRKRPPELSGDPLVLNERARTLPGKFEVLQPIRLLTRCGGPLIPEVSQRVAAYIAALEHESDRCRCQAPARRLCTVAPALTESGHPLKSPRAARTQNRASHRNTSSQ